MPGDERIGLRSNESYGTIHKRYRQALEEKKKNPHNAAVAGRIKKLRTMLNRAALRESQ